MTEETVRERSHAEEGQIVMPFYLVCDVSGSMSRDMQALNEGIRKLRRAIVAQPQVDDVAQLSIITFSTNAQVVLPLGRMSEEQMPTLSAQSTTNYGAAFTLLAQTIQQDIARLKAQKLKVYRPCAYFLTDGLPTDRTWLQTFTSTLTYDQASGSGMKGHPLFIPFGFRDASEDVLNKLAYPPAKGQWFHVKTHNIEDALNNILHMIMNSVISSGLSVTAGSPNIAIPTAPSGVQSGPSQYNSQWV